jgi:prophage antirepressor-like protein
VPKPSEVSFLERRLKIGLKLATSYLFYATLYRKGRIMPNQVLSFSYDFYKIRAVVDSNNELLFCLADICRVLNWYSTATGIVAEKIKTHFKLSEIPTYKFNSTGGNECFMITKPWLYFIIASVRGKKAYKANHFIQWVEAEVLPNLEQNSQPQALPQALPQPKSYGEALIEAGKLALENEKLLTQTKENQLKIEVFDELISLYRDFTERVNKTLEKLNEFKKIGGCDEI